MVMKKIDLYRQHKQEYVTPAAPVLLAIKPATYLAIEGRGTPGGARFTAAIGALYAVAFTIKMTRKFGGRQDYAVAKLEGFWDFDGDAAKTPRAEWRWTLGIRTPPFVRTAELRKAVATLLAKEKPAEVTEVRLETRKEGSCVQMLHVGPYDRESETIEKMRAFAERKRFELMAPHHEIYLSDPRRVPPQRLRTIIRLPVKRKRG
jgi:hypothetical protein